MSNTQSMALALQTMDPTWKIAVRVWWSWQWRTLVAGILLSIFVNFWIGIAAGMIGLRGSGLAVLSQIIGVVINAAVGLFFFKDVLDRQFKDFKVCVAPTNESYAPPGS